MKLWVVFLFFCPSCWVILTQSSCPEQTRSPWWWWDAAQWFVGVFPVMITPGRRRDRDKTTVTFFPAFDRPGRLHRETLHVWEEATFHTVIGQLMSSSQLKLTSALHHQTELPWGQVHLHFVDLNVVFHSQRLGGTETLISFKTFCQMPPFLCLWCRARVLFCRET